MALNLFNVAATIATTIVLAQVMGAEAFGVYSFVVATITLLGIPAMLGVDRLLTRDIAVHVGRGAYALAHGLFLRSQQLVLGISLVLGLAAAVAAWIVAGGVLSTGLLSFWLGAAALPVLALGRIVQGGLMGLHLILLGQAPEFVLRPGVLLGLVAASVAIGVAIDPPTAVLFYGLSLAIACLVSVALLRARTPIEVRRTRPVFKTRMWALTAVSLGIFSGTTVFNSQIGVTLLGAMSGSEHAGLFAVAQKGALLVSFPLAAVSAAIGPTCARLWSAGASDQLQRLITLSARGALLAALPLAFVFVVAGRAILVAFFGPEFAEADSALIILALAQLVNAATGTVATLLVMTGNQRRATLGMTLGALVNAITAVVLIPSFDTVGAALAAAAGLALSNTVLVITAYRELGLHSTPFGRIAFWRRSA
jgi:O-antigen/teichoic acid export membrane protein